MKKIFLTGITAILLFSFYLTSVSAADLNIEKKLIYNIPQKNPSDYTVSSEVFSNLGENFAITNYSFRASSTVVLNGTVLNNNYRSVSQPLFSPDGKQFVFLTAFNSDTPGIAKIIMNGQPYKNDYQHISSYSMIFSPDSKTFAFAASEDKDKFVLVNDKKSGPYDSVLVDLTKQFFSANSEHYAFTATKDSKMFVVYDGEELGKYDYVSSPNLNPDGKKIIYATKNNGDSNKKLFINKEEIAQYADIKEPFIFSSNGIHLAYTAIEKAGDKWAIFVDHKKVAGGYDDISNLLVGTSGKFAFIAKKGGVYMANINGKESKAYEYLANLAFSNDEKQSAFMARKGNNEVMVVNGEEGPVYPIGLGVPIFSQNGKHLVYKASRFTPDGLNRIFLYNLDGKEMNSDGWPYSAFSHHSEEFAFTPDNRYVIYMALKNNSIYKIKIDLGASDTKPADQVSNSAENKDIKKELSGDAKTSTETIKLKATDKNLMGKILLQVEDKGQAWYIHPTSGKRYYMANGDEAFKIMKIMGFGMSNKDIERIKSDVNFRKKFIGKILLQVESHGEAYYISSDGRYNYLKDGASAYSVMRKLGLGISNNNLNKIDLGK